MCACVQSIAMTSTSPGHTNAQTHTQTVLNSTAKKSILFVKIRTIYNAVVFLNRFDPRIMCMDFPSSCRFTAKHTLWQFKWEMDRKPFRALIYGTVFFFFFYIMLWCGTFSWAWNIFLLFIGNASVFLVEIFDDKTDDMKWSNQANNMFSRFQHINTILFD